MHLKRSSKDELCDADLVQCAISGDRRAFETLIRRHEGALRRQLFARVGSHPLAEDLAQETFAVAWRRIGAIDSPAKFGHWLRGIGKNVARKWAHRGRTDPMRTALLLEPEHVPGARNDDTPYDSLQRRRAHASLGCELRKLPADYATVLVLRYEGSLSCDEIASRLGISLAVVHQRLSRGRELLSKRIARFEDEFAFATLGAPRWRRATPEAFTEDVLRGLVERPESNARPARTRAKRATLGARPGLTGIAVSILLLFPILAAVAAAKTMLRVMDRSADERAPLPSAQASGVSAPPVAARPLPNKLGGANPVRAHRTEPRAPERLDYAVVSESTRAESAIFGAHDLYPMDSYGTQLYELFSKAFVMHLALCLRNDVVGDAARSRIDVELGFSLWPRASAEPLLPSARMRAEERDVAYSVSGLELSKLQKFLFSRCLENAFLSTGFPPPPDGRPRSVRHSIAIDFKAIQAAIDAACM
jgi:RNA polymerase sigma-70 factor (ECF subfamily)